MSDQGRFDVLYTYGCPVVQVTGDLDLTTVGEFEVTLELAARADRGSVIVCLSRTTYFDSQAIHVLLRFAEHLTITRQRLMIVTPRGTLPRRILEIAGLVQAFPHVRRPAPSRRRGSRRPSILSIRGRGPQSLPRVIPPSGAT